jgi:inner membrane protein
LDPLAHTLVGAALAETGLRRHTPLATATLIIGANAPDVDAVALFFGGDTALLWRRGLTHGVAALTLLPLLVAGAVLLYDRAVRQRGSTRDRVRPGAVLALACLSTWTHPALDWLNTYGVRLLMPFDGTWYYGDALFIIDPWLWLMTAAGLVLGRGRGALGAAGWITLGCATSAVVLGADATPGPARLGWLAGLLVVVALRARGARPDAARRVARVGVLALVVYVGAAISGTALARHQAEAWLRARGAAPTRVMAGPLPADPFVRDVIAVTPEGYRFLEVRWLPRAAIRESHPPLPGDERGPIVRAALAAPDVRGMANWLRFPTYRVEPEGKGWRVTIQDVRYSRFRAGIGTAVVHLDEKLLPVDLKVEPPSR